MIEWPTKPFYIQSRIGGGDLVLAVDRYAAVLRHRKAGIEHLWKAVPDPRGGSFLTHIESGLVLVAPRRNPEPSHGSWSEVLLRFFIPVSMAPLDQNEPYQLWLRDPREDIGGPGCSVICKGANWLDKLNVEYGDPSKRIGTYGWGGGDPNETWLLVEEMGELTIDKVHYDLDHAHVDHNLPPVVSDSTEVENHSDTILTGSRSLTRTMSTKRSLTNSESDTTTTKFSTTFGMKGGVKDVFEVSASFGFEATQSKTLMVTDGQEYSESTSDTYTIGISVPARRAYRYEMVVSYGKCTIPYTLDLTFQSNQPGAKPIKMTQAGIFDGVNATTCAVRVTDITSDTQKDHTPVALIDVPHPNPPSTQPRHPQHHKGGSHPS